MFIVNGLLWRIHLLPLRHRFIPLALPSVSQKNKKALAPDPLGQELNSCGTTRIHPHYTDALFPRTNMHAPWITGGDPVAPNVPENDLPSSVTLGLPS